MELALAFIIGFLIGLGFAILLLKLLKNPSSDNSLKDFMSTTSLDALSKASDEFIKIAGEKFYNHVNQNTKELDEKKSLIDKSLSDVRDDMKKELEKVQNLMTSLEKDRSEKYGELQNVLKKATEETSKLHETTFELKRALSGTKSRGNWGERMAEDVLRLSGFIENVNYIKQKVMDTSLKRPDFTFLLPQGMKINMDVKFPYDNYLKYLESEDTSERENYKTAFSKDVRNQIKSVTGREYINPQEKTLDYVLVFIPNEQIYSFLNEADSALLDDALKNRVVICSPITLYAILSLIRQTIDNFNLEKTSSNIIQLLAGFYKNWEMYIKAFDKLGKKIEETQEEFNGLTTTRKTMLDRSLKKIEELRKEKGLDTMALVEGEIVEE
ncbi:MAG: DNA recombination protein RmuC [Patescibacteria group bacterium]